jgi:soluble lytic murein transglycosylase-like protein
MNVFRCGLLGLCLASALPSESAVIVHLRNGSAIEAQSQIRKGDTLALTVSQGSIEIASSEVDSVEEFADPAPKPPPPPENIDTVAKALRIASETQGLPASFVRTVASVESGMKPDAVSPKGAVGLMQLMPATAAELGVKPTVPSENALGGARYLRQLLLRYKGDARLALAAYNAGPAAVDRYRGVPPFPETIAYVNKVLSKYQQLIKAQARSQNSVRAATVSER